MARQNILEPQGWNLIDLGPVSHRAVAPSLDVTTGGPRRAQLGGKGQDELYILVLKPSMKFLNIRQRFLPELARHGRLTGKPLDASLPDDAVGEEDSVDRAGNTEGVGYAVIIDIQPAKIEGGIAHLRDSVGTVVPDL